MVMTVINLLHADWFFGGLLDLEPFNPEHPYVCSLIIFPIALVICVYMLVRGHDLKFCRRCQARYGYYPSDGIVATLYFHESRYQLRLLLWLSLLLSVVDWAYYYFFYINVNYNSPDKFYFIVMPIALYVVSLGYMTARYFRMSEQITDSKTARPMRPLTTLVRYLVFAGDSLYLETDAGNLLDTPAWKTIPRREELSEEEAREGFSGLSGLTDFDMRFVYKDDGYTNGSNVLHYAVFLSSDKENGLRQGQWCTIDCIDRMIKGGAIAPLLMAELHRIYNVTMAWKTYDREGRRLYPIKNYQPTFRLRDFKTWDVDYDDIHWLNVATNNEDRPFFRIRRFWRRRFRP